MQFLDGLHFAMPTGAIDKPPVEQPLEAVRRLDGPAGAWLPRRGPKARQLAFDLCLVGRKG
jgi:hypothetical protein